MPLSGVSADAALIKATAHAADKSHPPPFNPPTHFTHHRDVPHYIPPVDFASEGPILSAAGNSDVTLMSSNSTTTTADFNPYETEPWSGARNQDLRLQPATPLALKRKSRYAVPAPSAGASGFVKHKADLSMDAVIYQVGDDELLAGPSDHRRTVTTDATRKCPGA